MVDPVTLMWILIAGALLVAAVYLGVRGFGLAKIWFWNVSRLKGLERRKKNSTDALERTALDAVIARCQTTRSRWILNEEDLEIGENTRRLVQDAAAALHPKSSNPVQEARIGRLLNAFLEVKDRALALTRLRGIYSLTQFRVRHVRLLAKAWEKKKQWQRSKVGQAVSRYKVLSLFQWVYALFRLMDVTFWMAKMLGYVLHDVVFKVLLVHWYLTVGELALRVYRDYDADPGLEAEDILGELEDLPEQDLPKELSEPVREMAGQCRRSLLFNLKPLEWTQVKTVYIRLVEDISRHYFPRSERPLYEAKIYDLLLGVARLSEELAEIRNQRVLNKLLDLRLSHIMMIKDTADFIQDSELWSWLKKYQLHKVLKYSHLIFKTISKRHPGVLFKDFAFALVKESGKRWFYIYVHDKIALEADLIYRSPEEKNVRV